MTNTTHLTVGILALQGGFHEHADLLKQAAQRLPANVTLETCFVRTPRELERCDALIIPGGESTTITLLAKKGGLTQPLREFVQRKPAWGTCAGMICLSEAIYRDSTSAAKLEASKTDEDVSQQQSFGGVDICVVRNQYGRQLASFEHPLSFKGLRDPESPFPGVFIRAPIVHHRLQDNVEVLATIPEGCLPRPKPGTPALGPDANLVALRQGKTLVTSFHPELSPDPRIHEFFIEQMILPSLQID